MDSGKQGCDLAMQYGGVRLSKKAAEQVITSAVFLDNLLRTTLNLMVLYPRVVRTVNSIHVTGRPPLKRLTTSHNPRDLQVKVDQ